MKNNILVLILVAGLLVLGFLYMKEKSKPEITNDVLIENNSDSVQTDIGSQTSVNQNENSWKPGPFPNILIPSGFEIIASDDLGFSITNNDIVIHWGGPQSACAGFGFTYGVSQMACVKSTMSSVRRADFSQASLSSAQLKLFGDFVLKNR
jgi:hypothetical protein